MKIDWNKYRTPMIVLLGTAVAIAGIIFQGTRESYLSNSTSDLIVTPIYNFMTEHGFMEFGYDSYDIVNSVVRKSAHVIEYGLAGVFLTWLIYTVARGRWFCHVWITIPLIYYLAVYDEYLQSFHGRTSTSRDVDIDFKGGLFFILAFSTYLFIRDFLRKRKAKATPPAQTEQKETTDNQENL